MTRAATLAAAGDFRWHLREATAEDHARLDGIVSELDVATRAGLAGFATAHLLAFRAMEEAHPRAELRAMIAALGTDLASLGAALPGGAMPPAPAHDPLAGDYLLAGSRMGTQVLRRRWAGSLDPLVRRADAYFALAVDPAEWPAVRAALSAVPVGSDRAGRIVADVRALYQLFERAALAARARLADAA